MKYLKNFQRKNGLFADGIVGKNTLRKMKEVFNIPSDEATAHFAAQLAHETANFKYGEENLNYSASALLRVFRKYFDTKDIASQYARNPYRIGSRVYANRMGNGDEQSGEGYLYRGRGAIQITGKDNYKRFSEYMCIDFVTNPDLVPQYYFDVALWFFKYRNIWKHTHSVNDATIKKVTRLINGGYNGLQHRTDLTYQYYKLLTW